MVAGSRKKSEHSIDWPADHLKMGFVERLRLSGLLAIFFELPSFWGGEKSHSSAVEFFGFFFVMLGGGFGQLMLTDVQQQVYIC
ncbi:hypothetical protein UYA_16660 [Ectopseudomonas alcaliphila JAB1]|nr:hypothetical protein UYA_16660 [Pseudomonas alcaliphila JAB1]